MIGKLIGSIFVIAGTTLAGMFACSNAKTRIDHLKLIKKVMVMLKGEINYSVSTLPDALETIGKRNENSFINEFCINVSNRLKMMNGDTLREIWYNAVDEFFKSTTLTKRDLENLKNMGDNLGYLDRDMHINSINMYLEQLDSDIGAANEEINNKCRIYKCMGVASGIFITIILV